MVVQMISSRVSKNLQTNDNVPFTPQGACLPCQDDLSLAMHDMIFVTNHLIESFVQHEAFDPCGALRDGGFCEASHTPEVSICPQSCPLHAKSCANIAASGFEEEAKAGDKEDDKEGDEEEDKEEGNFEVEEEGKEGDGSEEEGKEGGEEGGEEGGKEEEKEGDEGAEEEEKEGGEEGEKEEEKEGGEEEEKETDARPGSQDPAHCATFTSAGENLCWQNGCNWIPVGTLSALQSTGYAGDIHGTATAEMLADPSTYSGET
jgi:hypothetical protein